MKKAITIHNPWAYLIAKGIKDIENRSWETKYRGIVLIHAGVAKDERLINDPLFIARWNELSESEQQFIKAGIFVEAAIIGEVELVDCVQNNESVWATEGQWNFVLKNAKMYDEPIRNIRGQQKLWNYKGV